MDVFLSYAHADHEFAARLTRDLMDGGLSVWVDRENIEPGSNVLTSLLEAIRNSRIFMPLISKKASESPWFSSELAIALAAAEVSSDRRIVPVIIDQGAELPPFLRQFLAVDLSSSKEYRASLTRLLQSLKQVKITGAFPPPELLLSYSEIVPDMAEKIMTVAAEEASNRRYIERAELIQRRLGYGLGVTSALALIGSVLVQLFAGRNSSGFLYYVAGILSANATLLTWIWLRSAFARDNPERKNG